MEHINATEAAVMGNNVTSTSETSLNSTLNQVEEEDSEGGSEEKSHPGRKESEEIKLA